MCLRVLWVLYFSICWIILTLLITPTRQLSRPIITANQAEIREVIGGELNREIGLPTQSANILFPGLRLLASIIYSLDITKSVPEHEIAPIAPRPVLLIHGLQGNMIPFVRAQRLFYNAGENTELWVIPGGHTPGVRTDCAIEAPTKDASLRKVVEFFSMHIPGNFRTEIQRPCLTYCEALPPIGTVLENK